ncbi:MAG TPA: preprotein translocase subunit SecG [Lysobacter sp.]|nr:preprotein translocase subunit SecG [Lysobacter sp.]
MILTLLNVLYVLIAIAMIALILMQRGAGAQAGTGFGAGASATVFGSRGASNFLSKSTKWLAILFFAISLGMAWHASRQARQTGAVQDLGVMSQVPVAPATQTAPAAGGAVPQAPAAAQQQAPASAVPQAPAQPPAPANED